MKKLLVILFAIGLQFTAFAQVDSTIYTVDDSTVFTVVEQMPKYPGGDEALLKWLGKNVKLPDIAYHTTGFSGTIHGTFIVEKDGTVSHAGVVRTCGVKDFDDAMIKGISLMPQWQPGMQHGKPARVRYNLPMHITLR